MFDRFRGRAASLALASALLASGTTALAATAAAAPGGNILLGPNTACAWGFQAGPDKVNIAYPDTGATYWGSNMAVPRGGYIEIGGQFPHARYLSMATYSRTSASVDGLNDQAIVPDAGSVNPFLDGADRTAGNRSYTVRLVDGRAPETDRPANTLYTTSSDGARSTAPNGALFLIRVYLPDTGADLAGGVPLPTVTLVEADGRRSTVPACEPAGYAAPATDPGTGAALIDTPAVGLFGTNPPAWSKFTNLPTAIAGLLFGNEITGDTVLPRVQEVTERLGAAGGFFDNPDNKYIATTMDTGLGEVLVLRGKAPTAPHTLAGTARMGAGQVRYWSVCSNNPWSTAVYQCVYDEQIPVDAQGFYTIAVSTGPHRPANARTECGIAWLPAGTLPQAVLMVRNMMPAPGFTESIQNLTRGSEAAGMGPYYPGGEYYRTVADFEATGCQGN
ncbi:hypothetical protein [Nocardia sp. NPDC057668]|uniref:hypothetical protein n=1 Tax=Nocardia sp. NPDC057668 TaxID=3346202 RepID=UPI00366CC0E9